VNVEDIHDQNMDEEDEEETVLREVLAESRKTAVVQSAPPTEPQVGGQQTEEMSEGIAAAIARLRDNAG
jgi:DNA excision repair protein ERCC-1